MGVLRIALALWVIALHSYPGPGPFPYPLPAVELFFVVSGFYMGMVLTTKYRGPGGTRAFFAARFLRLYPTFVAVTVLTFGLRGVEEWAVRSAGYPPNWPLLRVWPELDWRVAAGMVFSATTMIGHDVPSLLVVGDGGRVALTFGNFPRPDAPVWLDPCMPIPPAWSIGCEVWFYLAAPVLVGRPRWLWAALVGSLLIRAGLHYGLGASVYYVTPAQAWYFLGGMLAYRYSGRVPPSMLRAAGGPAFGAILAVAAAYMYWGNRLPVHPLTPLPLAAVFAAGVPAVFARTVDWHWDRAVGELSYPVYLCHLILLRQVYLSGVAPADYPTAFLATTAAAVATAVVLRAFVERPFDRVRARFARPRPLAIGTDGIPPRLDPGEPETAGKK